MKLIAQIDLPLATRQPDDVSKMVNFLYTQMLALREQYQQEIEDGTFTGDSTYLVLELATLEGALLGINWVLGGNANIERESKVEQEILKSCNTDVAGYS